MESPGPNRRAFYTPGRLLDGHSWNGYEQDRLFLNSQDGRFVDVSYPAGGVDEGRRDGRGVALLDYNWDGALDVAVSNLRQTPFLLENRLGSHGNWLRVCLVGKKNFFAIGAQVRVTDGAWQILQEKRAGQGYASSFEGPLHFGLGQRTKVPKLEVRWPDGTRQTFADVPANRVAILREGSDEVQLVGSPEALAKALDPGRTRH